MCKLLTLLKMLSRFGIALCLLGLSVPAHAQIYSWRDANGNLVLSNKRPGDAAPLPSYTVPKADGLRATRSAVAERARVLRRPHYRT